MISFDGHLLENYSGRIKKFRIVFFNNRRLTRKTVFLQPITKT